MALLAIHAALKGNSIAMNDLLYAKGAAGKTIRLEDIAEETRNGSAAVGRGPGLRAL